MARQRPRIASGCSSHRRVEPSISVNKNVTVPDGNSLTTTPDGPQPQRPRVNQTKRTTSPAPSGAQNDSRRRAVSAVPNRRSGRAHRCADLRSYSGRVTERSVRRSVRARCPCLSYACAVRSRYRTKARDGRRAVYALPRRVWRPARFDGFEGRARVGDGFVVGHRGAASEQYGDAVVA